MGSGREIAGTLVLAAAMLAAGVTGLRRWDEAGWLPDPGHFVWLVVFTAATPIGTFLAVAGTLQLHHYRGYDTRHTWVPWARAGAFAGLAALAIYATTAAANNLAADVLRCGIVFCTGLNNSLPAGANKPNGKPWNGFDGYTGTVLFFVALALSIAQLLLFVRTVSLALRNSKRAAAAAAAAAASTSTSFSSSSASPSSSRSGSPPSSKYHAYEGEDVVALLEDGTEDDALMLVDNPTVNDGSVQRGRPARRGGGLGFSPKLGPVPEWRAPAILVVFFLVALPFFVACTMFMPPTWQAWTAASIDSGAAASVVLGSAEKPGASMTTANWKWSSTVTMKSWPDVLLFYGFIYVVSAIAVLGQYHPQVYTLLHHRPASKHARGNTVGMLLLCLALVALFTLWTVYWACDHLWHSDPNKFWREKLARLLGQLGNLVLGLAVLPVSRNSVWCHVFGVPWEASIGYHVTLGYAFIWVTTAHMLCWWSVYHWGGKFDPRPFSIADPKDNTTAGCMSNSCELRCKSAFCNESASSFPHDVLAVPMYYPNNRAANARTDFPATPDADNWTITLATVAYLVMVVCMGVFAYKTVRRKNWELFKIMHYVGFPVVLIAVLYHASSSLYFVGGGLLLWCVDQAIRFGRSSSTTVVYKMKAHFDHTELVVGKIQHGTGQYMFVNVPSISTFEWHPFSIASSPYDPDSSFHIKAMPVPGSGTFTDKLYSVAKLHHENPAMVLPTINMDGPHGLPIPHQHYDKILLIAGGIGITPVLSTFRGLYHLASRAKCNCAEVKMVWAGRFPSLFEIARETIEDTADDPRFSVNLYVDDHTAAKDAPKEYPEGSEAVQGAIKAWGRPNLIGELKELSPNGGPRTLVFVCGPPGLSKFVEMFSLKAGAHFHTESFAL